MSQIYENELEITFENLLDTPYVQQLRLWRNQDFVRKNMTNHALIQEEEHARYIESLKQSKTNQVFLSFYKGEPLAVITIKVDEEENCIEPGMYIINEKFLGQGFGIVMSYVRLEYIFERMPEGRMRTVILNKNEKNINLQKKMGCEFDRNIVVEAQNGEQEEASVLYLTKENWEKNKGEIEQRISQNFDLTKIGRMPVR